MPVKLVFLNLPPTYHFADAIFVAQFGTSGLKLDQVHVKNNLGETQRIHNSLGVCNEGLFKLLDIGGCLEW